MTDRNYIKHRALKIAVREMCYQLRRFLYKALGLSRTGGANNRRKKQK